MGRRLILSGILAGCCCWIVAGHAQGAPTVVFPMDPPAHSKQAWVRADWGIDGALTQFDSAPEYASVVTVSGKRLLRLKHWLDPVMNALRPRCKGAEIVTLCGYGYGRYRARVEAPAAPGLVVGFFVYALRASGVQEIDVELVTRDGGSVHFGTYAGWKLADGYGNGPTRHACVPIRDVDIHRFHEYGFDWRRDRVDFLIDGKVRCCVAAGDRAVPQPPATIRLNVWAPGRSHADWYGPPKAGEADALVDYVRFEKMGDEKAQRKALAAKAANANRTGENVRVAASKSRK